ncbi:hypothetical protein, partial [Ralstonia solanacearum]|uniref:hypothetical protein n=1 Tax=Ralstonia solanacearum TaxID=305 RepID=UPI001E376E8C
MAFGASTGWRASMRDFACTINPGAADPALGLLTGVNRHTPRARYACAQPAVPHDETAGHEPIQYNN